MDAGTGSVQSRIPLPVTATLLTFADGALWAASSENGLVERIDPESDRVTARAKLHGWISALAVARRIRLGRGHAGRRRLPA